MVLEHLPIGFFLNKAWELVAKWRGGREQERELYLLLQKALRKFIVDWCHTCDYPGPENIFTELKDLANRYREDLLNLTVQVEHLIPPELRDHLLRLAEKLRECVAAQDTMGSAPTRDAGEEATKIATNIINDHLAKKLDAGYPAVLPSDA